MSSAIYLRPVGCYTPHGASQPQPETPIGAGLPLSNTGLFFTGIEIASRVGHSAMRSTVDLGSFYQRDWPDALTVASVSDHILAARPRFAGLALDRPRIMGIVNVTPDSFSDGGRHNTVDQAIAHGLALVAQGADILDIGGESTRPGADPVAVADELARVIPVIEGLRAQTEVALSIDTRKAEVMSRAARAGADIINDVSALTHDPEAVRAAAESRLPVILMHAQGDPKTMNINPRYDDLPLDVFDYLSERIAACEAAGISRTKLCVDPGIGFAKHLHHNTAMMANLSLLHGLGVPILLGASRKKMISQLHNAPRPDQRLPGSLAAVLVGVSQGVQIVRVHDVDETKQALGVWLACTRGSEAGIGGFESS